MRFTTASLALLALTLGACGSDSASGTISLVAGADGNPLAMDPKPTTLDVTAIDVNGNTQAIAHGDAASTSFDLGDHDRNQILAFRVTAKDASGTVLVSGQSLSVQLGAIEGTPLPIFIQRTKAFAQMPGPTSDAREAPAMVLANGRYIVIAGGNDASLAKTSQIYDLLEWAPIKSPPALPRAPRSIAIVGLTLLVIDADGATWVDLSGTGATLDAAAPTGGTFAEVAGGATISAPDGVTYIVGATRTSGDPTARILKVSATGTLSFLALGTPRLGAAAAWVTGRGIVTAGGSATGSGVEVLTPGTPSAASPYPADPVVGAGIAVLPSGHFVLVGGSDTNGPAPVRELDPACAKDCTPKAWPALPTPLVRAQAVTIDAMTILALGEDATGATHGARLTAGSADDASPRVPRRGARGVVSPVGTFVIAGGNGTLESYAP